jgi:hypothetical protein
VALLTLTGCGMYNYHYPVVTIFFALTYSNLLLRAYILHLLVSLKINRLSLVYESK